MYPYQRKNALKNVRIQQFLCRFDFLMQNGLRLFET